MDLSWFQHCSCRHDFVSGRGSKQLKRSEIWDFTGTRGSMEVSLLKMSLEVLAEDVGIFYVSIRWEELVVLSLLSV